MGENWKDGAKLFIYIIVNIAIYIYLYMELHLVIGMYIYTYMKIYALFPLRGGCAEGYASQTPRSGGRADRRAGWLASPARHPSPSLSLVPSLSIVLGWFSVTLLKQLLIGFVIFSALNYFA